MPGGQANHKEAVQKIEAVNLRRIRVVKRTLPRPRSLKQNRRGWERPDRYKAISKRQSGFQTMLPARSESSDMARSTSIISLKRNRDGTEEGEINLRMAQFTCRHIYSCHRSSDLTAHRSKFVCCTI